MKIYENVIILLYFNSGLSLPLSRGFGKLTVQNNLMKYAHNVIVNNIQTLTKVMRRVQNNGKVCGLDSFEDNYNGCHMYQLLNTRKHVVLLKDPSLEELENIDQSAETTITTESVEQTEITTTSQDATSQHTIPADTTPQDTISQDAIIEETIPEDTTSQDTVPEDTIPQDTISDITTPVDTIPQDTTPQDTIPQDVISEDKIPQDTIPQDTTSQDTISQDTIPQDLPTETSTTDVTTQEILITEPTIEGTTAGTITDKKDDNTDDTMPNDITTQDVIVAPTTTTETQEIWTGPSTCNARCWEIKFATVTLPTKGQPMSLISEIIWLDNDSPATQTIPIDAEWYGQFEVLSGPSSSTSPPSFTSQIKVIRTMSLMREYEVAYY